MNNRHIKYILLTLTFALAEKICYSQTDTVSFKKDLPISTYYANTLSVHPFGIFLSRVNNNFQIKADKKASITLNYSGGNVWLPYVKAYNPLNEDDRDEMKNNIWYNREVNFDINNPSKVTEFQADGVIREYQLKLNLPISENHEIKLNSRMFSLDRGRFPYSGLTSDQFIEWFHSNIAGGEDPFARKDYGFNQANIYYKDADGKTMQIDNGDFIFSGIDLSYYYYPDWYFLQKREIYLNIGLQTGLNLSKINSSLDLGLNFTALKRVKLTNQKKELRIGLSNGVLRPKVFDFGNGVELSNNKFLLHSEFLFEYVKHINTNKYFSVATTWIVQNSYNKKSDFDYLVLTGQRIESHWHYAISHLYRVLSANNLVLSYKNGNVVFWIYLREDLLVDNAPDLQTGIGLKLYVK